MTRDSFPILLDGLVNIFFAGENDISAYVDKACEGRKSVADGITGYVYGDIKLKRSDKVTSVSSASYAVHVCGARRAY